MKNVFIAAIIAIVSTACTVGARRDTLPRECDETCQENTRLRQELARLQQEKGQQSSPDKTTVTQGANVSTATVWARRPHGAYICTVGAQPRQVTQGRKIQLDNQVCDKGSRDMWSTCLDTDDIEGPDNNTWLAFEIDGQPVYIDGPLYTSMVPHPETPQIHLLKGGQSCFVELGRSRTVKLTVKAYRNTGTSSYMMMDSTYFSSKLHTLSVGNRNILEFPIGDYSY